MSISSVSWLRVLIEVDDEKGNPGISFQMNLKFHPRRKKTKLSEQEIKELKALEDGEGKSKLE